MLYIVGFDAVIIIKFKTVGGCLIIYIIYIRVNLNDYFTNRVEYIVHNFEFRVWGRGGHGGDRFKFE